MIKGSKKLKVCRHLDFSTLIPDNPQPPICKLGHGFSSACMSKNTCPDYKFSIGISLDTLKEKYGLQ